MSNKAPALVPPKKPSKIAIILAWLRKKKKDPEDYPEIVYKARC